MSDQLIRVYGNPNTYSMALTVLPDTNFILDRYPNAIMAYSFRKLRTAYTGMACRIRRSSDNAEQDIGFDGSGNFDELAADAFINGAGAASGFIVDWYDQSINARHSLNLTTAQQPLYVASGIGTAARPMLQWDGVDDRLIYFGPYDPLSVFIDSRVTTIFVSWHDSAKLNNGLFITGAASRLFELRENGDILFWDLGLADSGGRVQAATPVGWDNNPHIVEVWREASDNQSIVVDGTSLVSGTRTNPAPTGALSLTIGHDGSNGFQGYYAEFVVWSPEIGSTARADVRTDMNAYYGVF